MRVKLMSYRVPPSTLPQALLWSDQPTVPQISTQIHKYTTQKYTNTKIHKYPNIQLYTQIYPTCLRRSCSQTNLLIAAHIAPQNANWAKFGPKTIGCKFGRHYYFGFCKQVGATLLNEFCYSIGTIVFATSVLLKKIGH